MTTAQPGQEQRMENAREMHWPHCGVHGDGPCDADCLNHDTRPTADLGEDGQLVERVIAGSLTYRNGDPMQDGNTAVIKSEDLRALCDRLILYREALEGLARFHESGGHEGDPDVVIGNARAVLSRSGG